MRHLAGYLRVCRVDKALACPPFKQATMCGIVGIYSHATVAAELYDSLIHLQHRGQDAAGIFTCRRTILC